MKRSLTIALSVLAGMLLTAFAVDLVAQGVIGNTTGTSRLRGTVYPLLVELVGTDGEPMSVGGGTQYAEDAPHASGNTGTLALAVRNDAETALAADGDNSVLQVDSSGALRVTGGGGGTQYAEDAAHADGNTGNLMLAVRRDAAASSTATDGDNATINVDALGRLWVNCGTGCSGGTQYAEDAAHADGNTGTLAIGVRRDAAASSTATDGDNATLNLDATGRLWSNTELLDAAALADNTANPTITGIAAYLMCYDGATWDRCAVSTDVTEDAAETAGGTGPMVMSVRRDAAATSSNTTGDNSTFNTDALGLLWTRSLDPCSGVAKSYIPIDIVTATTTELTAALAGASTHYYICSLNLVTAGANNVALVDDNTDGCGSPTAGVMGGFGSAAEGWNFAANGGLTLGSGSSSVGRTTTANAVLCLITSANVQLSGHIVVAAAP
jgi:hypothetical protein